jgi:hypothetical protein
MFDAETSLMAHNLRIIGNKGVPIFQKAVDEDTRLLIQAWTQITASMYPMYEVIIQFDSRLGNIVYLASGQGKSKAETEGGRSKQVHKECECLWFVFWFMVFIWV